MNRPELVAKGNPVALDRIELGKYDAECLRQHVMTVVIGGVEMPVWRAIENLLWVKDQDTRELIPFRLRWGQRYLYRELLKQGLAGKPMRLDILKARQLGFSTAIAAIFFLNAMFRPHTRWCVMADTEKHASNIFEMYQTFYDNLDRSLPTFGEIQEYEHDTGKRSPFSIKPLLRNTRAGQMMRTADNDSLIEVIVAGKTAGRSASYDGVHSSETGFQKDLLDTNISLFSTVSIKNRNSIIIIETTANGYNAYKDLWDKDASGNSSFAAVFVPWYKHPDYFLESVTAPRIEPWMYEKWEEHKEITKEQIAWYWAKYTEGYTEDKMKQEYPWDPTDAFISSGRSVFDMGKLKKRKDYLLTLGEYWKDGRFTSNVVFSPDGLSIDVTDVEFEEDPSGYFRIFEEPKPGYKYVVICDPSKGMNYDYSAIQVICVNPVRQVARFNAKDAIDSVARQIYCAATYYKMALVSVENNTGPTILDLLVKMHYPNIYVDQNQVYNDFTETYSRRYGHTTTLANRQPMIDSMVMGFRENPDMMWDLDTLTQMEEFQMMRIAINGGEARYKAMANGADAHDDLVMAFAPFWMVRGQVDTSASETMEGGQKQYEIRSNADYEAYRRAMRKKKQSRESVTNSLGFRW